MPTVKVVRYFLNISIYSLSCKMAKKDYVCILNLGFFMGLCKSCKRPIFNWLNLAPVCNIRRHTVRIHLSVVCHTHLLTITLQQMLQCIKQYYYNLYMLEAPIIVLIVSNILTGHLLVYYTSLGTQLLSSWPAWSKLSKSLSFVYDRIN